MIVCLYRISSKFRVMSLIRVQNCLGMTEGNRYPSIFVYTMIFISVAVALTSPRIKDPE